VSIRFSQTVLVGGRQFTALDLREADYRLAVEQYGITFSLGAKRILVPWASVLCIVSE
jgi:hypothetical protein